MCKETRDLGTEHLFVDAVGAVKRGNYLGDAAVVETLLRLAIARICDQFGPGSTVDGRSAVWARESGEFADIMLGRDTAFIPLHNWNAPGHIDLFLKQHIGTTAVEPDDVLKHAFTMIIRETQKLAEMQSVPGVLEEQVRFQFDEIMEQWAKLFLGVDLPTQMLMKLSAQKPKTDSDD